MKIYTCTPVRFKGDYTFFSRDSGLFSVGLDQIGVESRAIMPGPTMESDDPRLIRTDYRNLESEEWWRSLNLDGLIFYSWADPKYNCIAKAIKAAGIALIVNMDTCGLISPLANHEDWMRESHLRLFHEKNRMISKIIDITKAIIQTVSHSTVKKRIEHYEAATKIAAVTPHASIWIPNEAIRLGRKDLVKKFTYLPHPQLTIFEYDGTPKENLVVTVGRWKKPDWAQKNPRLLLESYRWFLTNKPTWKCVIVGAGAPDLGRLLRLELSEISDRLEFIDYIKPQSLSELYNRAKIGFWSSRWEGQQGTAAQALCCGCSVVSVSSSHNSCFRHYVSRESGRLASRNTPESLGNELVLEAESWENEQRDPKRIGIIWSNEFHADKVARRAINLLGLQE